MADGALYCEHCGEDIHIVPDFEPELEQNMRQIISGMVDGMEGAAPEGRKDSGARPEGRKAEEKKPGSLKRRKWILPVALAVPVLAAAVGMGVWVYFYNSREYQIEKAVQCVETEEYDRAIKYYSRALALGGDDIELQFSLAEVYFLKNNKIEYEYLLREITRNENATNEQLDRAYGRLIAIYRARGDYKTINDLLLGSDNEQLIASYQNYIATPPEFSVMEGEYTAIQPLKLTAMGTGRIYYTLDGSDPDENSNLYTMPIILENGSYTVKAVFINDNGISSEIVERKYFIDYDVIPAPEISVVSGQYNLPTYIEVMDVDGDEVYYTTDGSTPSYTSNAYSGPIPMPVGASHFRFARIVEGVVGEVADCKYELVLNTEYTPGQAADTVAEYSQSSGRIRDAAGHFDESGSVYVYEYLYVVNIDQISDFYVVAEVLRDAEGIQVRTGNYYAVDIYTLDLYQLLQEDGRGYQLNVLRGHQPTGPDGAATGQEADTGTDTGSDSP